MCKIFKKSFIIALTLTLLLSANYTTAFAASHNSNNIIVYKITPFTSSTSAYLWYVADVPYSSDKYIPSSMYVVYPYNGIGYAGVVYCTSVKYNPNDHLYYAHYEGYLYPEN